MNINDVGWIAVGMYNALSHGGKVSLEKNKIDRLQSIVASMTDKELEQKVRERVYGATSEEFDEIWTYIEEFKRDNPHITSWHDSSYWRRVGTERFPFTYAKLCAAYGKSNLTKSEEKMLTTYRGWTITLLMNTYGKHSEMEATRLATPIVYGLGKDAGWTREFG